MIRNQIEDVVKTLRPQGKFNAPSFIYGTSAELNLKLDAADFPVVMLYSLKPVDKNYTLSNAINSKFSIMMAFLFRTEFDQFTSDNEVYIQMANAMCDEFLVKLSNYRETQYASRYFKIHENDPAKALPVYNKSDVNSTGVTLTVTLNTMNNDNVIIP